MKFNESREVWFPEPFWKSDFYEMTFLNRYLHIHYNEFEDLDNKIAREKQKRAVNTHQDRCKFAEEKNFIGDYIANH